MLRDPVKQLRVLRVNSSLRVFTPTGLRSGFGGIALHDLVDQHPQLFLELARGFLGLALRVDVEQRLDRIGQRLHPPALVESLDTVQQIELSIAQTFAENAHDETL